MKYVMTEQHYDMKPGLEVEFVSVSESDTKRTGKEHVVVSVEGSDSVFVVPTYKLKQNDSK